MNVRDYISEELIVLDLDVDSKLDLLQRLTDTLKDKGKIADSASLQKLLLERERVMTTGIGKGFAIPHTFTDEVKESLIMYARLKNGLDYQSLDKQPVHHVFLLVGPTGAQGAHLRMLAKFSRLMSKDEFAQMLSDAKSPADVLDVIKVEEEKFSINPVSHS